MVQVTFTGILFTNGNKPAKLSYIYAKMYLLISVLIRARKLNKQSQKKLYFKTMKIILNKDL
jgi:hypothetical protein